MYNCFYSCNCIFYHFFIARIYLFVMTTNYICHIIHATITNIDIVTIEDLVIFMVSTKCLSSKCKNFFTILVLTFLLNGGLYQMMFVPLFFLSCVYCSFMCILFFHVYTVFSCVYCSFSNGSFSEDPPLSKMSL